jgi:hypothetical protein
MPPEDRNLVMTQEWAPRVGLNDSGTCELIAQAMIGAYLSHSRLRIMDGERPLTLSTFLSRYNPVDYWHRLQLELLDLEARKEIVRVESAGGREAWLRTDDLC